MGVDSCTTQDDAIGVDSCTTQDDAGTDSRTAFDTTEVDECKSSTTP